MICSRDLRHPIEIVTDLPGETEGGHLVPGEAVVCKLCAGIRAVKGQDVLDQGAVQQSETLEFTMRWREGLDTSMRVKWGGRLYEIERIDPVPHQRIWMRIWAHSLRRVGR